MMWRDEVTLIGLTYSQNDIGDMTESEAETTVFANKKSVRQSEFYQAYANGLEPEATFEMREIDYSNQKRLKHDSKYYDIIRTYSKNGEIVELICQRLVNS